MRMPLSCSVHTYNLYLNSTANAAHVTDLTARWRLLGCVGVTPLEREESSSASPAALRQLLSRANLSIWTQRQWLLRVPGPSAEHAA